MRPIISVAQQVIPCAWRCALGLSLLTQSAFAQNTLAVSGPPAVAVSPIAHNAASPELGSEHIIATVLANNPQLRAAQSARNAARRDPLTEVQLRADQSIAYGRVVEVMGLAQQAGLSRIGFVAQPASR